MMSVESNNTESKNNSNNPPGGLLSTISLAHPFHFALEGKKGATVCAGGVFTKPEKRKKLSSRLNARLQATLWDVSPTRGSDLPTTVSLSHEEAARGCCKVVDIRRKSRCVQCLGTGFRPVTCRLARQTRPLSASSTTCPPCSGTGRVMTVETFRLEFDPGFEAPRTIVLKDKGDAGTHGGPNGNLIVSVTVQTHPFLSSFVRMTTSGECELRHVIHPADREAGQTTVRTPFGDRDIPLPLDEPIPREMIIEGGGLFNPATLSRGNLKILMEEATSLASNSPGVGAPPPVSEASTATQ